MSGLRRSIIEADTASTTEYLRLVGGVWVVSEEPCPHYALAPICETEPGQLYCPSCGGVAQDTAPAQDGRSARSQR